MTNTADTQLQGETLELCPLAHKTVKGLHVESSYSKHQWHILCLDCDLTIAGKWGETIRELARRWNTRRAAVAGPRGSIDPIGDFVEKVWTLTNDRDGWSRMTLRGLAENLAQQFAATSSPTPAESEKPENDWRWWDTQLRATGYTDLANRMLAEFKPHLRCSEFAPAPAESTRAAGEQAERVKDAIIDRAIGCRNCGNTWERNVSADGIVAPCEDCGDGSYNLAASTPQPVSELQKLRQAIGWICDAADAAYIEDSDDKRIHAIFNIAAQAAGLTRRLPDEHGRFDETSIG